MTDFKPVDIINWNRRPTYDFYKNFDDPYFNVTVNVEITEFLKTCKSQKLSTFSNILFVIMKAVNEVDNFRMRFLNQELVIFDKINCGSTLFYEDETFGFAYYDYKADRALFTKNTEAEMEKAKAEKAYDPRPDLVNLIYFSALPWFSFTSFKHAQHNTINKSIPRISTGKILVSGDQKYIPISVEVNHALIDGYHVGLFFEKMEQVFASALN